MKSFWMNFIKRSFLARFLATFLATQSIQAMTNQPQVGRDANRDGQVQVYEDPARSVDERVADLLGKMTLQEKLGQLNQRLMAADSMERWRGDLEKGNIGALLPDAPQANDPKMRNALQKITLEKSRLGIPLMMGFDTIHGFRTVFPIPLAQACSFEPSLVERTSTIAARESAAAGVDWIFAPMCDVARDPRWGRVSEGFGEDPWLVSRFVESAVHGFQGDDLSNPDRVVATLKHFVGYGAAEGGRDYNTVEITDRTMRDVYLPPFEVGVKAGAKTVMAAFHSNGGIPATADRAMMTGVLCGEWKFPGFIVSDWTGVRELVEHGFAKNEEEAARFALEAGIDMEMVSTCFANTLAGQIQSGKISNEVLDRAVARILRVKFERGLFERPYIDETRCVDANLREDALKLAREAVQKSCVLLKNENHVLPLKAETLSKVALIGPLADNRDEMLGAWQGQGRQEDVVTLAAEMRHILGPERVVTAQGCPLIETALTTTRTDGSVRVTKDAEATKQQDITDAVELAKTSDVVILCLGEPRGWSGENASRAALGLTGNQQALFDAVAATGKPVVVILFTGRPLALPRIAERAAAILVAWQPGVQAGPGLCDLVFGKVSPTGRLAMSWPRTAGQVPIFYGHPNTGRPQFGDYKDCAQTPQFPFGFGLSYAPLTFGKTQISREGDEVVISAKVRNTFGVPNNPVDAVQSPEVHTSSVCDGVAVAQLYLQKIADRQGVRPLRELRGVQKISLAPGEEKLVSFRLKSHELARLGLVNGKLGDLAGEYQFWIAADSQSGEPAKLSWEEK